MDSVKHSHRQLKAKEVVSLKRPPPNVDWSEYSRFDLGLPPEWQWFPTYLAKEKKAATGLKPSTSSTPPLYNANCSATQKAGMFNLGLADKEWEWISSQADILHQVEK